MDSSKPATATTERLRQRLASMLGLRPQSCRQCEDRDGDLVSPPQLVDLGWNHVFGSLANRNTQAETKPN